jgi:hypothetical protein
MSEYIRPGSLLKFTAKDGRFDVALCIASEIQDDNFCRIIFFHPFKNKEFDVWLKRNCEITNCFNPVYFGLTVCTVSVLDL